LNKKLRMEKVILSDLDLQDIRKTSPVSKDQISPTISNPSPPSTPVIKFAKIETKNPEEPEKDQVKPAQQEKNPVAFSSVLKMHEITPEVVSGEIDQTAIMAKISDGVSQEATLPEKQVSDLADLEQSINDQFSMQAKGSRFIHQKEEGQRILINDDDAKMTIRNEQGQEVTDSYHGKAQGPMLSRSEESDELRDIVKKLSSLSHVKQVIVEKKKSHETTKLKMKVDNQNTGEVEDIDITAFDHRGQPIGIDYQQSTGPDGTNESQPLLVDSDGNIAPGENFSKVSSVSRPRPKTKEDMANGLRQISEKYERKTSHEKAVYKRTPKGHKNEYFYKVKSHQELYQIGMSYYRDMANGNKSMAFITHDSHKHLKDSILAIASFIKYQEDLKILIVSLGLENGSYMHVVDECKKNGTIVGENDENIPTIYEHAGLSFLDFKEIFSFRSKFDETGYGELIDYLVSSYDLVMWDVPKLDDLKVSKEEYFPIFIAFDKVSIVVKKQGDKFEDINEMKKFFNKYGIKIKGVLFCPPG